MSRRVTFKTLWLVSEAERKARRQVFRTNKTLFLGGNGTGKSRLTKNMFWVFGCEPLKRDVGAWDPDTVVGLDFEYKDKNYLVLRQGKRMGLFTEDGKLLFAADNQSSWAREISPFFGYHLQFQRPNANIFSQAGPDYLTLPFYMDQDGSWGSDWDTYKSLTQFKGSAKKLAFQAFLGMRPNAYFKAKQLKDQAHGYVLEKRRELDAQRIAFHKVRGVLPKNLPSLNIKAFRAELAELGQKALKVQKQQVELQAKLLTTVNLRQKVNTELQLAVGAHKDLVADLTYLSSVPDGTLECPTCGTIHIESFHARLQLSQDIEAMTALVAELSRTATGAQEEEAKIRSELRKIERALADLELLTHERRAQLKLEDVLAAHSKKTLDVAFEKVTSELNMSLSKLEEDKAIHAATVKQYEDRARQKEVSDYYSAQLTRLSGLLNVPKDEQISKPKPGDRGAAGGSSAARSLLAVHLAMLATNAEHGDTAMFPFVVDTPQQSGQDETNLRSMIRVLGESAGFKHQVILAVEELPSALDVSEFEIVHFDTGKGALHEKEFVIAVDRLKVPLRSMQDQILAQHEKSE